MKFSEAEIARVKGAMPISELIGRFVTFDKKKTNPRKGDFWACCPFHGEKSPSFHCEDRKGTYHCFGCGASGDHIRFLMQLQGYSFADAVNYLGGDPDVNPDPEKEKQHKKRRDEQRRQAEQEREQTDDERAMMAGAIFKTGLPVAGTPAELHLINHRGYLPDEISPKWFRYVERVRLGRDEHPALVCAARNLEGKIRAIWRIFIDQNGQNLKSEDGKKLKLGLGPAAGCAVRVVDKGLREICVTEGVETGFAVKCLTGGSLSVWAGLSTSGVSGLVLPDEVKTVRVFVDNDMSRFRPDTGALVLPPGIAAGRGLAEANKGKGIEFIFETPPMGSDWDDVWKTVRANG